MKRHDKKEMIREQHPGRDASLGRKKKNRPFSHACRQVCDPVKKRVHLYEMQDCGTFLLSTDRYNPDGLRNALYPASAHAQRYENVTHNKALDRTEELDFYDYEARQYDPAIGRFTTMDPLAEKYYSISPYAYCGNNPVNAIDPTGMAWYILTEDGRMVLARADEDLLDNENKTDRLYYSNTDKAGKENVSYINVSDKELLPQLTGSGGNYRAAETSNSGDAFNVFKVAVDNSNPEWSLKGYNTKEGKGFLLSTSYKKGSVENKDGSYDPSKLVFALHSHPDGTDNIGPSGSITKYPHSSQYGISGDLEVMYNRQLKSPNAKHYIYHEGTKKLIYYNWETSENKADQNNKGINKGVVNSGFQMRKKILGY